MDIQEIISKPDTQALSIGEMCSVVEAHTKEAKGMVISINILKNTPHQSHTFFGALYRAQVGKLMAAYNISKSYFINKT